MSKLNSLIDYIDTAINENRLIFIVVTSAAQGKIKTKGFSFGEGKSSLAMGIAKRIYGGDEEQVKVNMGYTQEHDEDMMLRNDRTLCWIHDDLQMSYSKSRSYDPEIKEMAGILSASRPYLAVYIGTCPHLGMIAHAIRELFMFEIKVPTRGYYEVQQIKHITPFDDPLNVRTRLDYMGESAFPKPSATMEEWYVKWRNFEFKENLMKFRERKRLKREKPKPIINESELSNAGRQLVMARYGKRAVA